MVKCKYLDECNEICSVDKASYCKTFLRKYRHEWYITNHQLCIGRASAWNKANKKRHNEHGQKWKLLHRASRWASESLRRHKRMGYKIDDDVTGTVIKQLLLNTEYICPICGVKMEHGDGCITPVSPTLDDIENTHHLQLSNIRVICHACNTMKGARSDKAWLEAMKVRIFNLERIVHGA